MHDPGWISPSFGPALPPFVLGFFLRAVFCSHTPLSALAPRIGWGDLRKGGKIEFDRYLEIYNKDTIGELASQDIIANPAMKGWRSRSSILDPPHNVPLLEPSGNRMYEEQENGITLERLHEFLAPYIERRREGECAKKVRRSNVTLRRAWKH